MVKVSRQCLFYKDHQSIKCCSSTFRIQIFVWSSETDVVWDSSSSHKVWNARFYDDLSAPVHCATQFSAQKIVMEKWDATFDSVDVVNIMLLCYIYLGDSHSYVAEYIL